MLLTIGYKPTLSGLVFFLQCSTDLSSRTVLRHLLRYSQTGRRSKVSSNHQPPGSPTMSNFKKNWEREERMMLCCEINTKQNVPINLHFPHQCWFWSRNSQNGTKKIIDKWKLEVNYAKISRFIKAKSERFKNKTQDKNVAESHTFSKAFHLFCRLDITRNSLILSNEKRDGLYIYEIRAYEVWT